MKPNVSSYGTARALRAFRTISDSLEEAKRGGGGKIEDVRWPPLGLLTGNIACDLGSPQKPKNSPTHHRKRVKKKGLINGGGH